MAIRLTNIFLILCIIGFKEVYGRTFDNRAVYIDFDEEEREILENLIVENLERRCSGEEYYEEGVTRNEDIGFCAFGDPDIAYNMESDEDSFDTTLTYKGLCGFHGRMKVVDAFDTTDLGICPCIKSTDIDSFLPPFLS